MSAPSIHPQFRSKAVCVLNCRHCSTVICNRGMKAILLGDTRVELFSTDVPPFCVQLVEKDYMTRNCRCRIRDVACLGCGNVIGYHVTQPCERCLDSCNNGHFWMFLSDGVSAKERMDVTGTRQLLWAHLSRDTQAEPPSVDTKYELLCR
ncbi:protein FAM72 [Entophlyctis helioformis]|nr:protein FAM72 [Entophlyctis helioformis]